MTIDQQVALLMRGTAGITPDKGLEHKLARSAKTGKPLNVKLGLDPTAPDIHLGFAVVLRKLRQFQDLGHQVILIVGDFTALIGDPSGRSATRPMLNREQIEANAKTYVDQLSRILDPARTTVRFNGEWLGPLEFAEVVRLCSRVTVARILERNDFHERLQTHQPLSLHELLYPLAQAYDSVAIESDVELGGTDQMFNILMGRDLQAQMGQDPQVALFMPLLVGLDGAQKMSKSLGNYVGISEQPAEMFGKIMSISDEMMPAYYELCTDVPMNEVAVLIEESRSGRVNPKEVKKRLAREIVSMYHGNLAALAADAEFERVHAQHKAPSEIREAEIPADAIKDTAIWVCRLLTSIGLSKGTSDARRLIEQGGVQIDGERIRDSRLEIPLSNLAGAVVQVGSRHFVRVKFKHP